MSLSLTPSFSTAFKYLSNSEASATVKSELAKLLTYLSSSKLATKDTVIFNIIILRAIERMTEIVFFLLRPIFCQAIVTGVTL